MTLLFDTHVWVWWSAAPHRIPDPVKEAVDRSDGPIRLSAISVWEVAKLVEKGRLRLGVDLDVWVSRALGAPGYSLAPLTPEVSIDSTRLPGSFHDDPADQIITATARRLGATLVTADQQLLDYPHVSSLWS